jgi:hypothetical protein
MLCIVCSGPLPPRKPGPGRPRKYCDGCRPRRERDFRKLGPKCAGCGEPMWRNKRTLPEGQARCHNCRRASRPDGKSSQRNQCADCGTPAYGQRCRKCADIAQRNGKTSDELLEVKRELRRRRAARDRLAPGLTTTQRRHLRAKWIRQRKTCAYCPAPATQVDHIVPLAIGGTNYIGNLAPACADCNRAKGENLLIEWRAGKKARRMRWDVPTAPRPKAEKQPPPAMCKVYSPTCDHCGHVFTARTRAKRFCSERCMRRLPDAHQCADCDVTIPRSRTKCDRCVAVTKRIRKRNQKRRQAARRRALQAAYPPGGGLAAVAA